MREPISFLRNDYCDVCKTNNVECYDAKHRGIGLSRLIDLHDKGTNINVNTRELGYMKCKECNTRYKMEWTGDNIVPRPLRDIRHINEFLLKYREER